MYLSMYLIELHRNITLYYARRFVTLHTDEILKRLIHHHYKQFILFFSGQFNEHIVIFRSRYKMSMSALNKMTLEKIRKKKTTDTNKVLNNY